MLQPLGQGIRGRTPWSRGNLLEWVVIEDSRPSKIVLSPYFLALALCDYIIRV